MHTPQLVLQAFQLKRLVVALSIPTASTSVVIPLYGMGHTAASFRPPSLGLKFAGHQVVISSPLPRLKMLLTVRVVLFFTPAQWWWGFMIGTALPRIVPRLEV